MMTLASATRIAVQIVVDDDTGNVAALIMALAALAALLVRFGGLLAELALVAGDIAEAARFTNVVLGIAFRSLAWGVVGIKC